MITVLRPLFFFHDTATPDIYTLSLHDALPISALRWTALSPTAGSGWREQPLPPSRNASGSGCSRQDRKSTRLNSSHPSISYAVFCLKKKKQTEDITLGVLRTHVDKCSHIACDV